MKKFIAASIALAILSGAPGSRAYALVAESGASVTGKALQVSAAPRLIAAPGLGGSLTGMNFVRSFFPSAATPAAEIPTAAGAWSAVLPASALSMEESPAESALAVFDSAAQNGVKGAAPLAPAPSPLVRPTEAASAINRASSDGRGAFDGSRIKPAILLVGTSPSRGFILTSAKRTAEALGYDFLLLDKASARDSSRELVPDANFIAGEIDKHDETITREIVDRIEALARQRPVILVDKFLNPYAQIAGDIVDRLNEQELGVKGLSGTAVRIAHTKSLAREAMAQFPEIATPYRIVQSAWEAFRFYFEQRRHGIVLKPNSGGGSQGVMTDIDRFWKPVRAFWKVDKMVREFTKRKDAGFFLLDQHPGILAERQLTGPETDIEFIMQNGEVKFQYVSDNVPMDRPHAVEKNSTFPSALPNGYQEKLIANAKKAALAMGIRDGNVHVEMRGLRVIEVNARMGGAFVWEMVKEQTGVDLVEQGIRAHLGLEVDPGRKPDTTLEVRFMIPQATGEIVSIEGLEKLKSLQGFVSLNMGHKAGDKIEAPPDSMFDYFGYIAFRGKNWDEAMSLTMNALESIKIKIRDKDGNIVEQTGKHTHVPVNPNTLLTPEEWPGVQAPQKVGALAKIMALPRSFLFGYTPGFTLNAMGAEIREIALPLFTAALFDLPTAVMVTGISFLTRVAGAWLGSSLMNRINPVRVNNAGLQAVALAGVALMAAGFFHASSATMLTLLLVNAVVNGLAYGVTRGVAENLLPKLIFGAAPEATVELGMNFAIQAIELGSIACALWVAVPLLKILGGVGMMAASSGLIGAASLFFSQIRFAVQWEKPASAEKSAGNPLTFREYAPLVFFKFMHFMIYGVMATLLALAVYHSDSSAGVTIGLYDGGSWLFGLLSSLSLLPKSLGRQSSAVLGAIVAAAFLWSAAALPWLPLTSALAGLLGGMVTINNNKWNPYFGARLTHAEHKSLLKWVMTWSIAGLLPIFAAVSAIRLSPAVAAVLTMPLILKGIAIGVSLLGLVLCDWVLHPKESKATPLAKS